MNKQQAIVEAKESLIMSSYSSVEEILPPKKRPTNFLSIFKTTDKTQMKPAAKEVLVLQLMSKKGFEREVAQYCLK